MQMRGNHFGLQLFATFRHKLCNAAIAVKMDNRQDSGTIRNPSTERSSEQTSKLCTINGGPISYWIPLHKSNCHLWRSPGVDLGERIKQDLRQLSWNRLFCTTGIILTVLFYVKKAGRWTVKHKKLLHFKLLFQFWRQGKRIQCNWETGSEHSASKTWLWRWDHELALQCSAGDSDEGFGWEGGAKPLQSNRQLCQT